MGPIECLLEHADQHGVLPMNARQIAALEELGVIVDLQTGDLSMDPSHGSLEQWSTLL